MKGKESPLIIDPILVYSTYIGGNDYDDVAKGIAVDTSVNAYVSGQTSSINFPTTAGSYDMTDNEYDDVFIVKINITGSTLLYASYLRGSNYNLMIPDRVSLYWI